MLVPNRKFNLLKFINQQFHKSALDTIAAIVTIICTIVGIITFLISIPQIGWESTFIKYRIWILVIVALLIITFFFRHHYPISLEDSKITQELNESDVKQLEKEKKTLKAFGILLTILIVVIIGLLANPWSAKQILEVYWGTSTPTFVNQCKTQICATTLPTNVTECPLYNTKTTEIPSNEIINPCIENNPWQFNPSSINLNKDNNCEVALNGFGFYPNDTGINLILSSSKEYSYYSVSRNIPSGNWEISFIIKSELYYGEEENDTDNKNHVNAGNFYIGLFNSKSRTIKYKLLNIINTEYDQDIGISMSGGFNIGNGTSDQTRNMICTRKNGVVTCELFDNEGKLIFSKDFTLDTVNKPFDQVIIGFELDPLTTINVNIDNFQIKSME